MRIVNLTEFMKLPKGTVYSKYSPCVFEGLMVKENNSGEIDWYYQSLIGNLTDYNEFFEKCHSYKGESIELDFDIIGRDAMYDKGQLFAVYEKKDIENFIKCLQNEAYQ